MALFHCNFCSETLDIQTAVYAIIPQPSLVNVWCGTEDFLYKDNVRFHKHAQKQGLDLCYEESPGTHTWKNWDQQIQAVLAWLGPHNIRLNLA